MESRQHEILIVARIADKCRLCDCVTGQVLELAAALYLELDRIRRIVKLRRSARTGGINGIQIQKWRAGI